MAYNTYPMQAQCFVFDNVEGTILRNKNERQVLIYITHITTRILKYTV